MSSIRPWKRKLLYAPLVRLTEAWGQNGDKGDIRDLRTDEKSNDSFFSRCCFIYSGEVGCIQVCTRFYTVALMITRMRNTACCTAFVDTFIKHKVIKKAPEKAEMKDRFAWLAEKGDENVIME